MTVVDPKRSALVLVDFMPRIVERPLEPRSGAAALDAALALAERARAASVPVVAIRVERPNQDEQPPGSGLVPQVARVADTVVVKRAVGGFHGTELDAILRELGAQTLVLAGIATNLGVESTARSAADLGYGQVFAEDAMTALSEAEHRAAVDLNLPRFGAVVPAAGIEWSEA
jgi:nicotinamidase-related amidase